MRLVINGVDLPIGEADVVITRQGLTDAAGIIYATQTHWELRGNIQVSDGGLDTVAAQDFIAAQLQNRAAAFSQNGGDLYLFKDDGGVAHALLSANTLGGVRVATPFQFPVGKDAEFATHRNYIVAFTALQVAGPFAVNSLVLFKESITMSGGGPRFVLVTCRTGQPVKQLVAEQIPFRATQAGESVCLLARNPPPTPLWPDDLIVPPEVRFGSPQRIGNALLYWPTTWTYQYESVNPLQSEPNHA